MTKRNAQRKPFKTIGMRMQIFGRNLIRNYVPSANAPASGELPSSWQEQPETPTVQRKSVDEIVQSAEAPVSPASRQQQPRPAPPRNDSSSSIDPRLSQIMALHERRAGRAATPSDVQRQQPEDRPAPPSRRRRSTVDYVATSALLPQDAVSEPTPRARSGSSDTEDVQRDSNDASDDSESPAELTPERAPPGQMLQRSPIESPKQTDQPSSPPIDPDTGLEAAEIESAWPETEAPFAAEPPSVIQRAPDDFGEQEWEAGEDVSEADDSSEAVQRAPDPATTAIQSAPPASSAQELAGDDIAPEIEPMPEIVQRAPLPHSIEDDFMESSGDTDEEGSAGHENVTAPETMQRQDDFVSHESGDPEDVQMMGENDAGYHDPVPTGDIVQRSPDPTPDFPETSNQDVDWETDAPDEGYQWETHEDDSVPVDAQPTIETSESTGHTDPIQPMRETPATQDVRQRLPDDVPSDVVNEETNFEADFSAQADEGVIARSLDADRPVEHIQPDSLPDTVQRSSEPLEDDFMPDADADSDYFVGDPQPDSLPDTVQRSSEDDFILDADADPDYFVGDPQADSLPDTVQRSSEDDFMLDAEPNSDYFVGESQPDSLPDTVQRSSEDDSIPDADADPDYFVGDPQADSPPDTVQRSSEPLEDDSMPEGDTSDPDQDRVSDSPSGIIQREPEQDTHHPTPEPSPAWEVWDTVVPQEYLQSDSPEQNIPEPEQQIRPPEQPAQEPTGVAGQLVETTPAAMDRSPNTIQRFTDPDLAAESPSVGVPPTEDAPMPPPEQRPNVFEALIDAGLVEPPMTHQTNIPSPGDIARQFDHHETDPYPASADDVPEVAPQRPAPSPQSISSPAPPVMQPQQRQEPTIYRSPVEAPSVAPPPPKPTIQQTFSEQPSIMRAPEEAPMDMEHPDEDGDDKDIENMARQIYRLLRNRLRIERERGDNLRGRR
jgi:hypothetical protein